MNVDLFSGSLIEHFKLAADGLQVNALVTPFFFHWLPHCQHWLPVVQPNPLGLWSCCFPYCLVAVLICQIISQSLADLCDHT